jgi:hypothetical protein
MGKKQKIKQKRILAYNEHFTGFGLMRLGISLQTKFSGESFGRLCGF